MSYRSYGDLYHESYDNDTLMMYRSCDREFCYQCGDSGNAVCLWCLDKRQASQPSA